MSTKELERQNQKTETVKAEPPRNWNVILHHNGVGISSCGLCILKQVFNMSASQAYTHLLNAQQKGKDIVFSAKRDAAETKADEAQNTVKDKEAFCNPYVGISFTAEPT